MGFNYGEASYLSTTFVTAVETILKDNTKEEEKFGRAQSQNLMPSYISTSKVETIGKRNKPPPERSYSMAGKIKDFI